MFTQSSISIKFLVFCYNHFMKAAILDSYGSPDVLQIREVPKPKIKENEILVRVKATTVTSADSRIRGARFPKGFGVFARLAFGITKPRTKILGSTYSGIVQEVGDDVSGFRVGDEVCGMTGMSMGTYAQFIKISKFKSIAIKPKAVSHEEAVGMLFGGTAALYFVRDKLSVTKNDEVLINGASGAVGSNAVQLARYYGAKVTAVTGRHNIDLMKKLGALHTLDYAKTELDSLDKRFDVVLDTVGNISPKLAKSLLNNNGRAGLMVAGLGETLRAHGQIKTGTATEKKEDIEFLLDLLVDKKLEVIIDKVYELNDITQAHKHVDSGHKVGNSIIRLEE